MDKTVKELKVDVDKLKADIRHLVEVFILNNENVAPCINIVYFEQRTDNAFGGSLLISKGVEVNITVDLKDE